MLYSTVVKKILIFSLAYYPQVGGAEVAIKEITDRIETIEWHLVTLRFSANDLAKEKIGNVMVYRVGKGSGYLSKVLFIPDAAAAAIQLHAKEKFDGIWAMMSYMLFPVMLLRLLGTKIPYALTLQEGDTYGHMFSRLRILPFLPLLNSGFRAAKVVQAISTYLGGWARTRGFTGPLEIIPNGVDVQKFMGPSVAHDGKVVITASRLVHKNAIDDCLRALVELPEWRFVIAGNGPDEKKLKSLAQELGVASRVEWLGHVDHAQLPGLLHASDVFVRPSRSEGMGNSFIEAFAAGVPVVATQEGGLKDFITPEVAWPVAKDHATEIATQIKAILSNPGHTAKVIENAKQLVRSNYDWSLIAQHMREKVFARLF